MTNYFLGARFFCPKSLRHKILLTSIRVSGSFLVSFLLLPKISLRPRRAKNCCERHFCFRRTYKKIFCSSFLCLAFQSHALSLSRFHVVPLSASCLSLSLPSPFLSSLLSPSPRRVFSSSRPRYFLLGGKKSWRIMIGASKANRKPRWRESQRLTSTAKS